MRLTQLAQKYYPTWNPSGQLYRPHMSKSTFQHSRAHYVFALPVMKRVPRGFPCRGSQILVKNNIARTLTSLTAMCVNKLWTIRQTMSFLVTLKTDYWLRMFLENNNIRFIKTIIHPLYDINQYALCKRLNIHLYLLYKID